MRIPPWTWRRRRPVDPPVHPGRLLGLMAAAAAVTLPRPSCPPRRRPPRRLARASSCFGLAIVGRRVPAGLGRRGPPARRLAGPRARRARPDRRAARVRRRLHLRGKAGEDPEKYAPLALANMTGGNRLLIGVGWSTGRAHRRVARHPDQPPSRATTGPVDTDVAPRPLALRSRSRSSRSRRCTR